MKVDTLVKIVESEKCGLDKSSYEDLYSSANVGGDFIKSNPSAKQISDIKDIGFDGLLKLKLENVPGHLAYWLVKTFNPFESSLMGGQLPIRDEDIHLAVGIPLGPLNVVQATKIEKSDAYVEAISLWKLGVKGVTTSLRILKCLRDVSLISSFNWCYFTRAAMIDSIMKWQENEKKGNVKAFKGPIMVLVLIYLDRVVFKLRSVLRAFPTLPTWTKEDAKSRIRAEKKEAGGFGFGFVDVPLVKENFSITNDDQPTTNIDTGIEVKGDTGVYANDCIRTLVSAASGLTEAFKKIYVALLAVKTALPNCEAVGQMEYFAHGLMEGVFLSQKLYESKDDDCPDAQCNDVQKNVEKVEQDPNENTKKKPSVSIPLENDNFFCNDELWAAVDELVKVFKSEHAAKKHCNIKRRRPPQDPSIPSFKLLDSQDDSEFSSHCTPMNVGSPLIASVQRSKFGAETSSGTHVPVTEQPSIDDIPPLPLKRSIVSTGVFKSPFLQRNINVLKDLTQSEKEISNFAFAEGLDDSEVLFVSGQFQLTRFDMKSLLSEEKISPNIINLWGQILNKQELNKSADSPLRLYAIVRNEDVICDVNVDFTKLMLMFFPFAFEEPVLICVNFLSSKIEVIHPMRPKSIAYWHHVQVVKNFIGRNMVSKSKRFQDVISKFKVEEYMPRLNIIDKIDTGIHLICHMEVYKGNQRQFPTGITKQFPNNGPAEVIINKLKVKYCHAILLFDLNALKDKVTKDAKALLDVKMGVVIRSPSLNGEWLRPCMAWIRHCPADLGLPSCSSSGLRPRPRGDVHINGPRALGGYIVWSQSAATASIDGLTGRALNMLMRIVYDVDVVIRSPSLNGEWLRPCMAWIRHCPADLGLPSCSSSGLRPRPRGDVHINGPRALGGYIVWSQSAATASIDGLTGRALNMLMRIVYDVEYEMTGV
ncbi:hypothetical protein RND81_12G037400 [Saponaria officinalis]|uniref:Uncharacterized protein n=1 Tax=Saponaria officinalis TaxID=3572 RepID=A0AAW1H2V7_SAPOF